MRPAKCAMPLGVRLSEWLGLFCNVDKLAFAARAQSLDAAEGDVCGERRMSRFSRFRVLLATGYCDDMHSPRQTSFRQGVFEPG